MASTAEEYKMLSVLADSLARIQDECGCELIRCEMTESRAVVHFRFRNVPHRMYIEKMDSASPLEQPEGAGSCEADFLGASSRAQAG